MIAPYQFGSLSPRLWSFRIGTTIYDPQLSHDVTFVKLADYGIERNESKAPHPGIKQKLAHTHYHTLYYNRVPIYGYVRIFERESAIL